MGEEGEIYQETVVYYRMQERTGGLWRREGCRAQASAFSAPVLPYTNFLALHPHFTCDCVEMIITVLLGGLEEH